jgi:hypothetical protein
MADLLDILPGLPGEIFEKYRATVEQIEKSDLPETINPGLFEDSPGEPEEENEGRGIDTVIDAVKQLAEISSVAIPNLPGFRRLVKDQPTREKVEKTLEICKKHPKLLNWVPELLDIEEEIKLVVSQSRIIRTGIQPSYYKAQTDAMIAEKVLSRPKVPEGWQTVVIVGLIILCIIVALLIASGKI